MQIYKRTAKGFAGNLRKDRGQLIAPHSCRLSPLSGNKEQHRAGLKLKSKAAIPAPALIILGQLLCFKHLQQCCCPSAALAESLETQKVHKQPLLYWVFPPKLTAHFR